MNSPNNVTIRPARPEDGSVSGLICYEAFSRINSEHGFPCDFPGPEAAIGLLSKMFCHPGVYCVVAESDGQILGSNCLDERSTIAGVGPITVSPEAQNSGIGRKLMQAVIDRANKKGAAGIRLVQAAFHNRSLSLYTRLGFDVREPLSCVQGSPVQRNIPDCVVRRAERRDLESCNALAHRVHGFDRGADLEEAIEQGTARVVERGGRVTGYTTALAFFGHSTAETNPDMQALIASAESFGGSGILLPARNSELLRWCLSNGLRIVQPLTLMSMGRYQEPAGVWLPSILF